MPNTSQIIVTDIFPITSNDSPLKLKIGVTGGINESATAWVCDLLTGTGKNSFTRTIAQANEVKGKDLIVVSQLVDLDKDIDTFTYKFKLTAGEREYEYKRTQKFDNAPSKGQSVKFITILSL